MKKLLPLFFLAFTLRAMAQPTLAHSWTSSVSTVCTQAGPKYYQFSNGVETIYNEDYTVLHSFNITYPASSQPVTSPQLISTGVVTTDGQYAYLLTWFDTAGGDLVYNSGLFKEDGTSLLSGAHLSLAVGAPYTLLGGTSAELTATNQLTQGVDVYSLPGCIPTCDYGCGASGIVAPHGNTGQLEAFPIPSSGEINLVYQMPDDMHTGNIILYNIHGEEIKRMPVNNQSGSITDNPHVAAGSYYYQLSTAAGNTVRKIIFIE